MLLALVLHVAVTFLLTSDATIASCQHRSGAFDLSLLELTQLLTLLMEPAVLTKLLILFIYSYVLSTGIKVLLVALNWAEMDRESDHSKSERLRFLSALPNGEQPFLLATTHYCIAYGGLVITSGLVVGSGALIPAICLLPTMLVYGAVVVATYKLSVVIEDSSFKQSAWLGSQVRGVVGWFRDLSAAQPTILHTLQFPRAFFSVAFRDAFVGVLWGEQYSDAGFLTLGFGLQIFWMATFLSPLYCKSIFLVVPFMASARSPTMLSHAIDLVVVEYSETVNQLASIGRCISAFDCDFSWLRLVDLSETIDMLYA